MARPLPCLLGPDREDGAKQIILSRGLMAVIDPEDVDVVVAAGKWYADAGGRTSYARRNYWEGGRSHSIKLHYFLTGWNLVDHINGDGLDNRRCNLRQATYGQNARNSQMPVTNSSGFKGASWHKQRQRWSATIYHGRKIHLGLFDSPQEAALAYDAAALALFGDYARVNFPGRAA